MGGARGKSVLPSIFRAVSLKLLSKTVLFFFFKNSPAFETGSPFPWQPQAGAFLKHTLHSLPTCFKSRGKSGVRGVGKPGNRGSRHSVDPAHVSSQRRGRFCGGAGPGRPGAVGTPPAPRSACGKPPPEITHHAEARCPAPPPRGTRSAPGTGEVTHPALRRHLNPGEVWPLRTPAYSPPSLGEEKPEARQQAEPGDPLSWRTPRGAGQSRVRPRAHGGGGTGGPASCSALPRAGRCLQAAPFFSSPTKPQAPQPAGGRGAARDARRHHGNKRGLAGGRPGTGAWSPYGRGRRRSPGRLGEGYWLFPTLCHPPPPYRLFRRA